MHVRISALVIGVITIQIVLFVDHVPFTPIHSFHLVGLEHHFLRAPASFSQSIAASQFLKVGFMKVYQNEMSLVGGFNPSEKYESQLGWLFPTYGKS